MEDVLESQWGKVLIILYTLFAVGCYVYALMCTGNDCALAIIWPIMPWALILASDLGLTFSWVMYPVLVLLNASVAYCLGSAAQWVYYRVYAEK